ncbi:hypothetical protein G5576_010618, partial [Homo sapiens]
MMNFRQRMGWIGVGLYLLASAAAFYYVFEISETYNRLALEHIQQHPEEPLEGTTWTHSLKAQLLSLPFWGSVKRQALYACSTCTPEGEEPAGICLACSYECHGSHKLFELYTKRNFRCDCGNSKFKNLECKLLPDKAKVNSGNKYNDNFFGLYCICKRPYPDPEDE